MKSGHALSRYFRKAGLARAFLVANIPRTGHLLRQYSLNCAPSPHGLVLSWRVRVTASKRTALFCRLWSAYTLSFELALFTHTRNHNWALCSDSGWLPSRLYMPGSSLESLQVINKIYQPELLELRQSALVNRLRSTSVT